VRTLLVTKQGENPFPDGPTSLVLAVPELLRDNDSMQQTTSGFDPEMRRLLEYLLSRDEYITARAVVRLDPQI